VFLNGPLTATPALVEEFEFQPVDGAAVRGRLGGVDRPWRLQVVGASPLDGRNLLWARKSAAWPVLSPSGSQVLLANGDRVRGILQRATAETLDINSELLGDMSIPLEQVRAMLPNPPADRPTRDRFCNRLAAELRKDDVVILGNGDEIAGAFMGLGDGAVRLETAQGALEITRSEVRAVAMSSELVAASRPAHLFAQVMLADGSEISLVEAWTEGLRLRGRASFGREVSIPLSQVVGLEFRNGRATYLSDVEPSDYRHTPYLGVQYDWHRDRSVLGNVQSIRGQVFRKGLGVHSRSELTYKLDGLHRRFEAVAGIDDETAGHGSVIFRVLLDDKVAWESEPLSGRATPQPVRVDLGESKKITLVVDFADLGDVQDHADWGDARLVR
jgi:hypothetical protein